MFCLIFIELNLHNVYAQGNSLYKISLVDCDKIDLILRG